MKFKVKDAKTGKFVSNEFLGAPFVKEVQPPPKKPRKPRPFNHYLPGTPTLRQLDVQAKKNVGGRASFKSISAYRLAVSTEKQRLKEKYGHLGVLEDTGKSLSLAVGHSTYRKEFAAVARIVCSIYGSTQEELAKFFCVPLRTIQRWSSEHPAFNKAIYDRSTELNVQVMGRLARKALGFHMDTEKIFYDVKRGDVVRVPTKEYYPPSEAAIFFWLKNRMPEHWKDAKDVNIEENRKVVMEIYKNFETLTQEQATDAYQELLKAEGTGIQLQPPSKAESASEDPSRAQRRGSVTDVTTDSDT